jgi:sugar phosphate isomerase/epimerase
MDKRNQTGRTAQELSLIFAKLPNAGLCFDLGHCRQVDPTMNEAFLILNEFSNRLVQLHVSEVNTRSKHDPLTSASIGAFEKIAHLIPASIPVILESPVEQSEIETEIDHTRQALPTTAHNGNRKHELRVAQNGI